VSKPVRIYDATYAEIEQLAQADRRSVANMVQLLLERGLETLRDGSDSGAASPKKVAFTRSAAEAEATAPEHFKPDPKPGRK
jgi:hypothetical protein